MKKVLITGVCGFLGSHLAETHAARRDKVYGVDNLSRGEFNHVILDEIDEKITFTKGDILDFDVMKTIERLDLDVIYHMAALPSHRNALERPHEYINIDIMGTANVLEAARLCKKKPLVVFASSNKVYGKQECPWKEDMLPKPEGPYAVSKYAAEILCEMYYRYFGVPCVILRYHHVAGKRSNPELALSVFTEQIIQGKRIEVHGAYDKNLSFASCSADYTHVDDAIRATLLAVDAYKGFDIYNIANKKLTFVSDLAKMVFKKLHKRIDYTCVEMLPHETLVHHSDVSKAEKKLGFVAEIPVEQAVADYVKWRVK